MDVVLCGSVCVDVYGCGSMWFCEFTILYHLPWSKILTMGKYEHGLKQKIEDQDDFTHLDRKSAYRSPKQPLT